MHGQGFDKVTPEEETQTPGPTKWRRQGDKRRDNEKENMSYVSDHEKRTTGDRRSTWLQFISKIIFPRGTRES